MNVRTKLPAVETSIFTVMSAMARECDAINLSQGFPNYSGDQRLTDYVHQAMQAGHNQYAPMGGFLPLREQLAQKIERLYGSTINPETEITITAGATQAIFTIISAMVHAGDEVILIEPAYDSYGPSVEVNGGVVVPYALQAPDYRVDWEAFARLITPKTRLIIINSPHNPTGTVWTPADLEALQQLAIKHDLFVLSDEVYEHLIYDDIPHQSILRYPALFQRSFATYSFGKTFHNTGWKIGYCVAPAPLMEEFRKVHQFNVFSVNHPAQRALATFLEDPESYLSLAGFYQEKRDFFNHCMESTRFKAIPCSGTYFQLFDYSAISDLPDRAFAEWLTKEHGVATIPTSPFYSNGQQQKVVRFCFAKTKDLLEKAAERLQKV